MSGRAKVLENNIHISEDEWLECFKGVDADVVFSQIAEGVNDGKIDGNVVDESGDVAGYWVAWAVDDDSAAVRVFKTYEDRARWYEKQGKWFLHDEHDIAMDDMYTTKELQEKYEVKGFLAPCVSAVRRKDSVRVSFMFGNVPPYGARIYYSETEHGS